MDALSIDIQRSASSDLFENFEDKEYRDAYVDADIVDSLALQIAMTREARGWSQRDLAERAGMTQSSICRLEDPAYGKYTIQSLKRLASALDVALLVRMVPFSRIAIEADFEGPDQFTVPEFADDSLAVGAADLYQQAIASCRHLSLVKSDVEPIRIPATDPSRAQSDHNRTVESFFEQVFQLTSRLNIRTFTPDNDAILSDLDNLRQSSGKYERFEVVQAETVPLQLTRPNGG